MGSFPFLSSFLFLVSLSSLFFLSFKLLFSMVSLIQLFSCYYSLGSSAPSLSSCLLLFHQSLLCQFKALMSPRVFLQAPPSFLFLFSRPSTVLEVLGRSVYPFFVDVSDFGMCFVDLIQWSGMSRVNATSPRLIQRAVLADFEQVAGIPAPTMSLPEFQGP